MTIEWKMIVSVKSSGPTPVDAPERVLPQWTSLAGCAWAPDYERELPAPPDVVGPFLRNVTDGLTFPLTILWALEKLNEDDAWTSKEVLNVHVRFLVSISDGMLILSAPGTWCFTEGGHAVDAIRRDHAPAS